MANEIRLRRNNIAGTITDNPLTNVATTINSPGFVDLPTVDATNHLILVLDPLETNGPAEIVRVTTHTAAASVVTVTRGAEGSAARSHANGTTWFHGPVASDWRDLATSGARPTVPYTGMEILETDTLRNMQYTGTTWQQNGLYWDPPSCRVFNSAVVPTTSGVSRTVPFDSERWDTDNMHSTTVNNDQITIRTAGLYIITAHFGYASNVNGIRAQEIQINGNNRVAINWITAVQGGNDSYMSTSAVWKCAVNDTITLLAFQNSGTTPLNLQVAGGIENYSAQLSATWIGRGN